MNDVTTAEKVLSYGDRAVAQGKRVADVPAKKGAPKPPPPATVPAHVDAARKLWQQHFATTYAKPPVVIHDIGKAPSGLIQKSDFDGWTNSATQIFVHSKANVSPASLFVTIHHEAVHIGQFRAAGGKTPSTYSAMMEYEYKAYEASALLTQNSGDPAVKALNGRYDGMWDMFTTAIDDAERKFPDKDVREVEYGKWLVANKMLPPHKKIDDLYR